MLAVSVINVVDTRTLFLALSFTLVVSTLALVAYWRATPSLKGLGYFALGFVLQVLGTWLLVLRGYVSISLSVIVGNLFVLWGYAAVWIGLCVFWSRQYRLALWLTAILSVIMLVSQYYYSVITDELNTRVFTILIYDAILLAGMCQTLLSVYSSKTPLPDTSITPGYRGVLLLLLGYGANVVFNIYRAFSWDTNGPPGLLFEPNMGTYLAYFGGLILTVLIPLAVIIMAGEVLEARLKAATILDVLTGAYTRDTFQESASLLMARAERHGEPISLLVCDLDFFKQINDTHGHAAGDTVLAAVGKQIRLQKRNSDLFGRIGGDEFVVLLPLTDHRGAKVLADRLVKFISSQAVYASGASINPTISVGVASSEQDGQSYGQLFERADQALFEAKRTGRNRYQVG